MLPFHYANMFFLSYVYVSVYRYFSLVYMHLDAELMCSVKQAESGGSGTVSRRVGGQPGGAEQFVMQVPNKKVLMFKRNCNLLGIFCRYFQLTWFYVTWIFLQVGLVIGKGGETIKNMQASTGARIQVYFNSKLLWCDLQNLWHYCSFFFTINCSDECVSKAKS